MAVDLQYIKEQAKLFYAICLKNVRNPPPQKKKTFKASKGWLIEFLESKGFKHVIMCWGQVALWYPVTVLGSRQNYMVYRCLVRGII